MDFTCRIFPSRKPFRPASNLLPFARKYGVLASPLTLWIEDSTIGRVATEVPGLEADFNKYLDANPANRRVEELRIGTNEG